jgi:hypothetical protein
MIKFGNVIVENIRSEAELNMLLKGDGMLRIIKVVPDMLNNTQSLIHCWAVQNEKDVGSDT